MAPPRPTSTDFDDDYHGRHGRHGYYDSYHHRRRSSSYDSRYSHHHHHSSSSSVSIPIVYVRACLLTLSVVLTVGFVFTTLRQLHTPYAGPAENNPAVSFGIFGVIFWLIAYCTLMFAGTSDDPSAGSIANTNAQPWQPGTSTDDPWNRDVYGNYIAPPHTAAPLRTTRKKHMSARTKALSGLLLAMFIFGLAGWAFFVAYSVWMHNDEPDPTVPDWCRYHRGRHHGYDPDYPGDPYHHYPGDGDDNECSVNTASGNAIFAGLLALIAAALMVAAALIYRNELRTEPDLLQEPQEPLQQEQQQQEQQSPTAPVLETLTQSETAQPAPDAASERTPLPRYSTLDLKRGPPPSYSTFDEGAP